MVVNDLLRIDIKDPGSICKMVALSGDRQVNKEAHTVNAKDFSMPTPYGDEETRKPSRDL